MREEFTLWNKGGVKEKQKIIAIQILSYNKPKYLKRTLDSLIKVIGKNDKICVLEQSTDSKLKMEAIEVCKQFNDMCIISIDENLGQRGGSNKVWESGFYDDCDYVMFSDHDNEFYEPLSILCDKLDVDLNITVATFYNSPEHDVTSKDGKWIYRETCRAGHIIMRAKDVLPMFPFDVDMYSETKTNSDMCTWFAGLDWYVTWWHHASAGKIGLKNFIACYPGGCTHFGVESTWQGKYDDEISRHDSINMRNQTMQQIVKKYPPRHLYRRGKLHWYEKDKLDLKNVTLAQIDCVDYYRALKTIDICTTYADFGDVKFFTSIDVDNDYVVKIPHCKSVEDVAAFQWYKMNDYIETDYILHIEYDSFILNPDSWSDEFLEYDYIGAPWWFEDEKINVGNGGFALFSKKLLNFTQTLEYNVKFDNSRDDISMCRENRKFFEDNGIKFAPEKLASQFSLEANSKYGCVWNGQFGVHSPAIQRLKEYSGGTTNVDNWKDRKNFRWPKYSLSGWTDDEFRSNAKKWESVK
jgi:hypothetical protein